jgi:hypothetical protein
MHDTGRVKTNVNKTNFEWYRFISSLLHKNLRYLDVPSSEGRKPAECRAALQNLLDAICANCPNLKSIYIEFDFERKIFQSIGSSSAAIFMKKLPKLGANLQVVELSCIDLDDWALQQFALHTPLLV